MSQLYQRWELIPSLVMNSIVAWNVRGLKKSSKRQEVAKFITLNNIFLFRLLEMKVKRNKLGPLYQIICYNWCFTHYMSDGKIILGWRSDHMSVSVLICSKQLIHIAVTPVVGEAFVCAFVYRSSSRK